MSKRVVGYVVRAYLKSGKTDEYNFPGTGLETLIKVQDKVNELLPKVGDEINSVTQGAVYAEHLSPPKPKSQATRHQREIA
jgi:hypothetical protein